MREDELLERTSVVLGLGEREEARRVAEVVIGVLGECLEQDEREPVARALPPTFAAVLRALPVGARVESLELVLERVGHRAATSASQSREVVTAVFELVGAALDADARLRLVEHLPHELGALLEPVDRSGHPDPRPLHVPPRAPRLTVSEARPGGHHPVAEAHERSDRPLSTAGEEPEGD